MEEIFSLEKNPNLNVSVKKGWGEERKGAGGETAPAGGRPDASDGPGGATALIRLRRPLSPPAFSRWGPLSSTLLLSFLPADDGDHGHAQGVQDGLQPGACWVGGRGGTRTRGPIEEEEEKGRAATTGPTRPDPPLLISLPPRPFPSLPHTQDPLCPQRDLQEGGRLHPRPRPQDLHRIPGALLHRRIFGLPPVQGARPPPEVDQPGRRRNFRAPLPG